MSGVAFDSHFANLSREPIVKYSVCVFWIGVWQIDAETLLSLSSELGMNIDGRTKCVFPIVSLLYHER